MNKKLVSKLTKIAEENTLVKLTCGGGNLVIQPEIGGRQTEKMNGEFEVVVEVQKLIDTLNSFILLGVEEIAINTDGKVVSIIDTRDGSTSNIVAVQNEKFKLKKVKKNEKSTEEI